MGTLGRRHSKTPMDGIRIVGSAHEQFRGRYPAPNLALVPDDRYELWGKTDRDNGDLLGPPERDPA